MYRKMRAPYGHSARRCWHGAVARIDVRLGEAELGALT